VAARPRGDRRPGDPPRPRGRVVPPFGGFFAAGTPYAVGRDALHPDARRFETAGFNKAAIVGVARSAGWLSMYVGLPWAHERAARLASAAAERLAATAGVTLLTPRERMATLVSFQVAGWVAADVVEVLGRRAHAIVRSIPGLDAVRLSVGFFNSDEELGRVLDAVEEIAAHTPGTLPAGRRSSSSSGRASDPRASPARLAGDPLAPAPTCSHAVVRAVGRASPSPPCWAWPSLPTTSPSGPGRRCPVATCGRWPASPS